MPPFSNFSIKAQEAVRKAHELATERGQSQIDALHLLAALLLIPDEENVVLNILEKLEIDIGGLTDAVVDELEEIGRGEHDNLFRFPGLSDSGFGESFGSEQ